MTFKFSLRSILWPHICIFNKFAYIAFLIVSFICSILLFFLYIQPVFLKSHKLPTILVILSSSDSSAIQLTD